MKQIAKFERKPMHAVSVGDYMRGPRGPWKITKLHWRGKDQQVDLRLVDSTGVTEEVTLPADITLEVMSLLEMMAVEADERYTGS